MASNDLDKQKALQKQIRENLEAVLQNTKSDDHTAASGTVLAIGDDGGDPFMTEKAEHPNAKPMDFHREKKTLEKEAKKIVSSAMKFYVDNKYIGKEEYLEFKKNVDAMTLSNLMMSMKFTQHAIIKIMEDIDMGNTHPRTFEALATLNGQMMSVVKHIAAFQATVENSMRQAQLDLAIAEHKAEQENTQDADATIVIDQPTRVRGTKGLIQGIKKELEMPDKPETLPPLTDPGNRPINPFVDNSIKDDDNNDNIIDANEYF